MKESDMKGTKVGGGGGGVKVYEIRVSYDLQNYSLVQ